MENRNSYIKEDIMEVEGSQLVVTKEQKIYLSMDELIAKRQGLLEQAKIIKQRLEEINQQIQFLKENATV
jgi:uncharacterized coiled-coil DUF342 family protein